MNKSVLILLIFLCSFSGFSQVEKYPVFKACDSISVEQMSSCFKTEIKNAVINEFKVPEIVSKDNYRGTLRTVFLVTASGDFKVIYINSPYKELKSEIERVFSTLPKITPAKYNNHAVEMQFVLPLKIPLQENIVEEIEIAVVPELEVVEKKSATFNNKKLLYPEHHSELNVPFVHSTYTNFDKYLNKGDNTHTSMKPYMYSEVMPYLDLDAQSKALLHDRETWGGRKLWNEHLVNVQGEDFWVTLDLPLDLQLGKDSEGTTTFNNTRALQINGGIGKNFNFTTTFYESQGKFAEYFNEYAESIKPDGGNPALIPGRGIAKGYKTDSYDYPVAEAYLSYSPSKYVSFQFGNGKNFIGDGYRSLLLSDVASPVPFFKINTNFWKIKYTNIWMWAQDVRPELTVDGAYKQKFMSLHYLSLNVTKKLNIGLFETVIWDDANGRGFDVNFMNPIIFYTAAEFSTGSRAGNVLVGMNLKYKFNDFSLYGQVILDDFRASEMISANGWWANKFGFQIGAKYFNAFNVENLYLQAEYNLVRPFTYSHDELNYNYGHNNQPMAHLWGSNFKEFVAIGRYSFDRWFFDSKVVIGTKGFDFDTDEDSYSYGGNVFKDNDDRVSDYENTVGQGNTANVFIGDIQAGYLINPATNLKLYGRVAYRSFQPTVDTETVYSSNSTWVSIGLKAELFNWYFDF